MRRVFVGLAQVFVGLAAQLRNNRLLQKYALETDPGAGCEKMHSVKIILSPYTSESEARARAPRPAAHAGAGRPKLRTTIDN